MEGLGQDDLINVLKGDSGCYKQVGTEGLRVDQEAVRRKPT